LDDKEIAALLKTSRVSVTRTLRFARAWMTSYVRSIETQACELEQSRPTP
jgi:hypothetical protein